MKRAGTLLLTLILSGFSALRCGATVYQSDGSAAGVQGLHNAILNGDTIKLPAGTFTWTTRVNFSKAITLQGTGATIIRDAVQNGQLISINLVAGRLTRLTGIEFQNGGRTSYYTGVVTVTGSNTNGSQFRMDHCKWGEDVNGSPLFDTVIGVIDHNTFIRGTQNAEDGHAFWVFGSRWGGNSNGNGDGSWPAPTDFGSSQFLFFEDNTFTSTHPSYLISLCDAYDGARFVLRHNTITGFTFQNHGTESSGRRRGSRATEFYNNNCDGKNLNQFVGGSRSGSQVIHHNTCVNFWSGGTWNLQNYRSYAAFPVFGGADGTNPWDVNDPRVYFTGTATQNSSGTTVTVSGNPNWTTNQWVGYVVRRTTNLCNVTNANTFGLIVGNTSNTLTWIPNAFTGLAALSICAGDSVEIRKVIWAMDMPGRARGSLLANVFNPPVPPGWNDQVTEPVYAWNNGSMHVVTNLPNIHEGEHYHHNTPMPGYTPYVYPHPLVTGGPTPMSTLGNISTRGFVQTGDNVMIGGFIIQGTEPKTVIMRAIGPSLTQHSVPNALADPTLELHDGTGALIASNYNWQTTHIGGIITANQVSAIRNSGYAPSQARESAIIATLPPGNYTAIVSGVNNTTGVALVDAYDLSPGASSILGNISTRGFVQTGDNVMIGGFIIQGTEPKTVIMRAIGPSLTQHSVPNALADPTLELHDGTGALIASNYNWQTTHIGGIITANQVSAIRNSGYAPSQARESAIIATLPPGNYTAIVSGVNNTTGVALVDVYDLQ